MNRRGLLGLLVTLAVGLALFAYSPPAVLAEENEEQGVVTATQMVVPPGHWSYQAVTYLQSQGVLGAGEVATQGLTRYDFARISAQALAQISLWRKAGKNIPIELDSVVERLLIEYSPELSQLARSGQGGAQAPRDLGELEERVSDLEEEISELADEQSESAGLLQSLAQSARINGYVSLEYEDGADSDSRFNQHQASLWVTATPFERTSLFSEIEFEEGGEEVGVEFLHINYDLNARNSFIAGKLLMPIGWFNPNHSPINNTFTSMPMVAERITPASWAEAGLGLMGQLDKRGDLNYSLLITQGMNQSITQDGLRGARPSAGRDNNNAKAFLASLNYQVSEPVSLGASWYRSVFDNDGNALDHLAFFFNYDRSPWRIRAEYATVSLDEVFTGVPPEEGPGLSSISSVITEPGENGDAPPPPADLPTEMWGYYIQADYLVPTGGDSLLTLAIRWGQVDTSDLTDEDDTDRLTIGFNFRPNPRIIYKLEYQFNDSKNPLFGEDRLMGSVVLNF